MPGARSCFDATSPHCEHLNFIPTNERAPLPAAWRPSRSAITQRSQGTQLSDSVRLFERAAFWAEWFGAPYLIENPVSTISTYWRKPDYKFHPWEYSGHCPDDTYTKKTCLWTGNGFVMPPVCHAADVEPDDRIHKAPPSAQRADFRSATPRGFARALMMWQDVGV
jgi:hypothetical protein